MNNLVNTFAQCWGCPIFDHLFSIISKAGALVYTKMISWAWVILAVFWVFYSLWVVYQNLTSNDNKDYNYMESVKPVLINSLIVCVLLGMGVSLPRFIGAITFEPVATMTSAYANAVLQTNAETVRRNVTYQTQKMDDNGFFRPQLRDKVIDLMRVSITQFQSMIKLGVSVISNVFTLNAFKALDKYFLMLLLGFFLVGRFFSLFIKYCLYFVDVIIALAMFAFFFPFMLVFFVFKNSKAAGWVTKLGDAFTPTLLKNVINAMVGLVAAIIVYTIAMVIVAKFFSSEAMSSNIIVQHILDGSISAKDLSDTNLVNLTLFGCIVIGYIIDFLTGKIKGISDNIFKAFGVNPETKMNEEIANKITTMTKNLVAGATSKISKAVSGEKTEDKKDDKKDDNKDAKK